MATPGPSAPVVSGRTRLYAVLGDPVEQVRAPALLNPLFARLGLDAVLVPVHVRPQHLELVVRGLQHAGNVDGLLVTVPHKAAVRRFADRLGAAAAACGSANALRRDEDGRWLADNFDGAGFVRGLVAAGRSPAGAGAVLVGAGGAGSAIAVALLAAGARQLSVVEPDRTRRDEILGRLRDRWPDRVRAAVPDFSGLDPAGADLVVNATPLGLRPSDPLPFDPARLPPHALVADIVMTPARTALLAAASAAGLAVHPGRHMLEHQVELYRDFFGLDRLAAGQGRIGSAPASGPAASQPPTAPIGPAS